MRRRPGSPPSYAALALLLIAVALAVGTTSGQAEAPAARVSAYPGGVWVLLADDVAPGERPGERPLLGALPLAASDVSSASPGSVRGPMPRFSFGEAQGATGIVRPVGSPNAVPLTPLAVYQTAVARRMIQPDQTPNAVPGISVATPQTRVTQPASPTAPPTSTPVAPTTPTPAAPTTPTPVAPSPGVQP